MTATVLLCLAVVLAVFGAARAANRRRVEPPSITCPRCGMTSYNPNDIREGYCGHCHDWTRVSPNDGSEIRTKTGRILTDADIEALADEAERGYDLPPNDGSVAP